MRSVNICLLSYRIITRAYRISWKTLDEVYCSRQESFVNTFLPVFLFRIWMQWNGRNWWRCNFSILIAKCWKGWTWSFCALLFVDQITGQTRQRGGGDRFFKFRNTKIVDRNKHAIKVFYSTTRPASCENTSHVLQRPGKSLVKPCLKWSFNFITRN